MWSARVHEVKIVFRCETHLHKWGRVQGMKPNDSLVHSHFGSCTHVGVVNVYSFGWKGKKMPNWAPKTPLERSWSLHVSKVHLDLICMNYDTKKSNSNWEFDSQPQILGKHGSNKVWLGHVIHCLKDPFELPLGSPGEKWHLDVVPRERRIVYYMKQVVPLPKDCGPCKACAWGCPY